MAARICGRARAGVAATVRGVNLAAVPKPLALDFVTATHGHVRLRASWIRAVVGRQESVRCSHAGASAATIATASRAVPSVPLPTADVVETETLLMTGDELTAFAHSVATTLRAAGAARSGDRRQRADEAFTSIFQHGCTAAQEVMLHPDVDARSFHALLAAYRSVSIVEPRLLRAVQPAVEQRMQHMSLAELSTVAHVYAALESPPRHVLEQVATLSCTILRSDASWNVEDAIQVLVSCVKARTRPVDLLRGLADRISTPGPATKAWGRTAPHRKRHLLSMLADVVVKCAVVLPALVDSIAKDVAVSLHRSVKGLLLHDTVAVSVRRELVTDASSLAYNLALLGALARHEQVVVDCIRVAIIVGNITGAACARSLQAWVTSASSRSSTRKADDAALVRMFDDMKDNRSGAWALSPGDHPANVTRVYRSVLGVGANRARTDGAAAAGPEDGILVAAQTARIVPQDMLLCLRSAFVRTVCAPNASIVSDTQRIIVKRLTLMAQAAGWPTPVAEHVTGTGLVVDVAFTAKQGQVRPASSDPLIAALLSHLTAPRVAGLAFEIDGPCHYVTDANSTGRAGATTARLDEAAESASAWEAARAREVATLRRMTDALFTPGQAPQPAVTPSSPLMLEGVETNVNTLYTRWILQSAGWTVISISLPEIQRFIHGQPNARVDAYLLARIRAALEDARSSSTSFSSLPSPDK